MQRYSRDREREDEGGRSERGAQARNDDRSTQATGRAGRSEFAGGRDTDYDRGRYESASDGPGYAAQVGSNRWQESGGDRERFEQSYGRSVQQSDYYGGGSAESEQRGDQRGGQRDDDWRDRGGYESGGRWQPGGMGGAGGSWTGQRRAPSPQYGETDYGMYGPRYGGSGSGQSNSGQGGYWTGQQSGGWDAPSGERGDDRWNRQGYGRSAWQHGEEHGQHHHDPDYQRWRSEQIRNLDDDYARYRHERYRKFADEFDQWRRSRAPGDSPSSIGDTGGVQRSPMSQSGMGQSGLGVSGSSTGSTAPSGLGASGSRAGGTGNQSGMGSSGGQTSTGSVSSSGAGGAQDTASKDTSGTGNDTLGSGKR